MADATPATTPEEPICPCGEDTMRGCAARPSSYCPAEGEEVTAATCSDCGCALTAEEAEYLGNACCRCEEKASAALDAELDEPPRDLAATLDRFIAACEEIHAVAERARPALRIERSRDAQEIANLRALVTRLTNVAQDLAACTTDPGTEALAAIHCGRNFIYG